MPYLPHTSYDRSSQRPVTESKHHRGLCHPANHNVLEQGPQQRRVQDPQQLHADHGSVEQVDQLLEQRQVVYGSLVVPWCPQELNHLAFDKCSQQQG